MGICTTGGQWRAAQGPGVGPDDECAKQSRLPWLRIITVGFGGALVHREGIRGVRMKHGSIRQLCFQVKNLMRSKFI